MPTFIDESGDTGWKPGSLPFFRLGAVWLPTFAEAEACRASIQAVRVKLGMKADQEFKFARTARRPDLRREFFQAALRHEFRFVVCAYDKKRLPAFSVEASEFHWGCAVTLASYLRETYRQAETLKGIESGKPTLLDELIVVDDNQDRDFLATIKTAFRALASGWRPGGKLVGKVKFRGSRPDEMLQMVDMVVGAAGEHLDGDSTWHDLISARSLGIIRVP
ncbi:MAG: DUF3800 domain-containing protein [Gemmataceae bacterium]